MEESRSGCLPVLVLIALAYWGWSAYSDHKHEQAAKIDEVTADADYAQSRVDDALKKTSDQADEISSLRSRLSDAEQENAQLRQQVQTLQSQAR